MGIIDTVKSWVSTDQGSLNKSWDISWWQEDKKPGYHTANPDVAACINLYKRALTAVPIKHIVRNEDGAGIEANETSALSQVLLRPNQYMSTTELIGVIVDQVLRQGEFVLYVEEDGRGRRTTVHPVPSAQMVVAENGDVFYQLQWANAQQHLQKMTLDDGYIYIPQRHIVHGRFAVNPRDPTKAMTPIESFATSIGLGSVIRESQYAFHHNKGVPSGILTTEATLTGEQATRLRERWNEMSAGMQQGKTPILSNGLRWQSTSVSAGESQAIQMLGFTTKDIAKAFGVPYALLGDPSGTTYNNSEVLINTWRTTGLLSLCMTIEQAFEYTFGLPKNEEMVIDIANLARAESLAQADTLTKLVQNGVMKPNEARAKLDLHPIAGVANDLVAQQQIQPIQQTADLANKKHELEQQKIKAQADQFEATAKQRDAQAAKDHEVNLAAAKNPKPTPETPPEKKSLTEDTIEKSLDDDSFEYVLKGIFAK